MGFGTQDFSWLFGKKQEPTIANAAALATQAARAPQATKLDSAIAEEYKKQDRQKKAAIQKAAKQAQKANKKAQNFAQKQQKETDKFIKKLKKKTIREQVVDPAKEESKLVDTQIQDWEASTREKLDNIASLAREQGYTEEEIDQALSAAEQQIATWKTELPEQYKQNLATEGQQYIDAANQGAVNKFDVARASIDLRDATGQDVGLGERIATNPLTETAIRVGSPTIRTARDIGDLYLQYNPLAMQARSAQDLLGGEESIAGRMLNPLMGKTFSGRTVGQLYTDKINQLAPNIAGSTYNQAMQSVDPNAGTIAQSFVGEALPFMFTGGSATGARLGAKGAQMLTGRIRNQTAKNLLQRGIAGGIEEGIADTPLSVMQLAGELNQKVQRGEITREQALQQLPAGLAMNLAGDFVGASVLKGAGSALGTGIKKAQTGRARARRLQDLRAQRAQRTTAQEELPNDIQKLINDAQEAPREVTAQDFTKQDIKAINTEITKTKDLGYLETFQDAVYRSERPELIQKFETKKAKIIQDQAKKTVQATPDELKPFVREISRANTDKLETYKEQIKNRPWELGLTDEAQQKQLLAKVDERADVLEKRARLEGSSEQAKKERAERVEQAELDKKVAKSVKESAASGVMLSEILNQAGVKYKTVFRGDGSDAVIKIGNKEYPKSEIQNLTDAQIDELIKNKKIRESLSDYARSDEDAMLSDYEGMSEGSADIIARNDFEARKQFEAETKREENSINQDLFKYGDTPEKTFTKIENAKSREELEKLVNHFEEKFDETAGEEAFRKLYKKYEEKINEFDKPTKEAKKIKPISNEKVSRKLYKTGREIWGLDKKQSAYHAVIGEAIINEIAKRSSKTANDIMNSIEFRKGVDADFKQAEDIINSIADNVEEGLRTGKLLYQNEKIYSVGEDGQLKLPLDLPPDVVRKVKKRAYRRKAPLDETGQTKLDFTAKPEPKKGKVIDATDPEKLKGKVVTAAEPKTIDPKTTKGGQGVRVIDKNGEQIAEGYWNGKIYGKKNNEIYVDNKKYNIDKVDLTTEPQYRFDGVTQGTISVDGVEGYWNGKIFQGNMVYLNRKPKFFAPDSEIRQVKAPDYKIADVEPGLIEINGRQGVWDGKHYTTSTGEKYIKLDGNERIYINSDTDVFNIEKTGIDPEKSFKKYLNVPYADKNIAKRAGAKWDPDKKRWYAPSREVAESLKRYDTLDSITAGEGKTIQQLWKEYNDVHNEGGSGYNPYDHLIPEWQRPGWKWGGDDMIDYQGNKGAMLQTDNKTVIYALTDPNVSTPLHELSHVYEKVLKADELKAIENWSKAKRGTTEFSESFARGFEKYLSEGIAPNKKLEQIFKSFKQWLTDIYKGITGSEIDLKLNDEMRRIYNDMLGGRDAPIVKTPTEQALQKVTKTETPIKTRKFAESLQESTNVNPEVKTELAKKDFTYQVKSNRDTIQNAQKRIEEKGLDDAKNNIIAKPIEKLNDDDIAEGIEIGKQLQAKGDTDEAVKVFEKLAETGTQKGREVQIFRTLNVYENMDAGSALYAASKNARKGVPEAKSKKAQAIEHDIIQDIKTVKKKQGKSFIQKLTDECDWSP